MKAQKDARDDGVSKDPGFLICLACTNGDHDHCEEPAAWTSCGCWWRRHGKPYKSKLKQRAGKAPVVIEEDPWITDW